MSNQPFRFSLGIGGANNVEDLTITVKKAEAAGFDVVSGADHIGSYLAVLPKLAAAAAISSLRVSTMVIANDYRHPVILAKDTATIDVLSEGRFELGIGTGWIEEQYAAAGLPYDDPKVRVDRFEEAIEVIKGCWSGQPFTFTGDHYQVTDVTCPQPVQRPHLPILIGGAGRRMLTIAGREADIVSIGPLRPGASGFNEFAPGMASSGDRIQAQLDWIYQGAGARYDEIELSVMAHHLVVTDDVASVANQLAKAGGTTADQVLESPHVLVGPTDAIVETLQYRRERYGISYVVFGGDDLDAVEPVVSRLAGT